jgi:two-component system sensor histidine kinase KdpD
MNIGQREIRARIQRCGLRSLAGIALIGLVTFICYGLHFKVAAVGFVDLIVIVLQALAGDFASSAIVSLAAVLFLDYFFIPPILSFDVPDQTNILALLTFLVTSLVITRLTSNLSAQAEESELQRREMKHLYELAQILLELDPQEATPQRFLERFRSVFRLRAVCLFAASTADVHMVGQSNCDLPQRARDGYLEGISSDDLEIQISVRCLRASGRIIGAIAFEGLRNPEGTADPLASLATVALERSRVFQRASESVGTAQAEAFRGAVLDALAHEFKTPLATVLAAMSGLTEARTLGPEQQALAETVETEILRLNSLTSRLLRTASLDREEITPQIEAADIASIIGHVMDQYAGHWTDHEFSFEFERAAYVMVDAELIRLVLSQLLENACKYSAPGSQIHLSLSSWSDFTTVRIWNTGSTISPNERSRIFERFYRGKESLRVSTGSGLGLYVARKIALAHGGNLTLEEGGSSSEGTAFCLDLPTAKEISHDNRTIQCASRR